MDRASAAFYRSSEIISLRPVDRLIRRPIISAEIAFIHLALGTAKFARYLPRHTLGWSKSDKSDFDTELGFTRVRHFQLAEVG